MPTELAHRVRSGPADKFRVSEQTKKREYLVCKYCGRGWKKLVDHSNCEKWCKEERHG